MVKLVERNRTRLVLLMICTALGGAAVLSLAAEDRQVNNEVGGIQERPSLAPLSDGGTVFVWSDRDENRVEMRRFDSSGQPLDATEIQVGTAVGAKYRPQVTSSGDGTFQVVWAQDANTGSLEFDVLAQRFQDDGTVLADPVQITRGINAVPIPAMAFNPAAGTFFVVWKTIGPGVSRQDIGGRRLDSSGQPLGAEFLVNTSTIGQQTAPTVASNAAGQTVVAWHSKINQEENILFRRFDSVGTALGQNVLVTEESFIGPLSAGIPNGPAVAMEEDGDFLVAWLSRVDVTGGEIVARFFDSNGLATGGEFVISGNATPTSELTAVRIGTEFEVIWDRTTTDIFSRRIDATGQLLGTETVFTQETAGSQRYAVAFERGGELVATWSSPDAASDGVFTNLPQAPEIFADGFESGDVGAWSESQP